MAEGDGVCRWIVALFGKRFANLLSAIPGDFFARIPTHLPFDAVLVIDRHESSRRFLVGARWHGIKGQDELINPPKALSSAENPSCAVGKTGFAVENFNVLGRFLYSQLVRRSLLRRLLLVHFFV